MDTKTLLDRARDVLRSDAKTANYLGCSPQMISQIRSGKKNLSDYDAARLAEKIGEPWLCFIELKAEKAGPGAEREWWKKKLRTLGGLLSAILILVNLGAVATTFHSGKAFSAEYTMRTHQGLTDFWRWLVRFFQRWQMASLKVSGA